MGWSKGWAKFQFQGNPKDKSIREEGEGTLQFSHLHVEAQDITSGYGLDIPLPAVISTGAGGGFSMTPSESKKKKNGVARAPEEASEEQKIQQYKYHLNHSNIQANRGFFVKVTVSSYTVQQYSEERFLKRILTPL